ncbi:MAG TPA: VWA domain-containing protein [Terriglobales bacterium]|jgi:VWFA-related protein|nr:VWA domain-containing protein [Terriglobales bacterium]
MRDRSTICGGRNIFRARSTKCWEKSAGQDSVIKRSSYLLFFLAAAVTLAQEPTFRTQSNVVIVPALVRDVTGHVIYGLHAADFVIDDDGVEQTVQLDESAEAEPVSLMLAVQTGRRAWREFGRVQGLSAMLAPILDQNSSQIAVLSFDSHLNLVQDFTGDPEKISESLRSLEAGDNGAAILDAVDYAVKLLKKTPEGRQRVLLLISETRDHGSHWARVDDVVTLIGDSNTTVYSLTFSPSLSQVLDTERGSNRDEVYWNVRPDVNGPILMAGQALRKNVSKAIVTMSGGEYELFESRKRFETRMMDFTNHLHNRYMLSFEPKNPKPGLHHIRVRLKDPGTATVLARSSYWAAGPAQ